MAVQSDLRSCVMWVTERPYLDRLRKSSYFSLLGEEWYFEIYLKYVSIRNGSFYCHVCLHRRSGGKTLETPIVISCRLIANNLIFKDSRDFSYEHSFQESGDIVFECYPLQNSFSPSPQSENWNLFFQFSCAKPLSFQLNDESIHLSTVRDENPLPLTVDRSVQTTPEIPPDVDGLCADISTLLQDEIFPDFRLQCQGRTFPVHRSVLAARSEVFRAMFRNRMQESESGSAVLEDLEVPVLESLLKFVYSGKLEDISEDTASQLYEAADKYAIPSLSKACSYWLVRNLTVDNCVECLKTADAHSDPDLKAAATSFILGHPVVFKSTAWSACLKEHPVLASELLQTYALSSLQ